MSACTRSILCPIAVLPLFWHAIVFKQFCLYMLKTICICEMNNAAVLKYVATMHADITLTILYRTGSICIKAVASKIMQSVFTVHVTLPSDMPSS